MTVTKFYCEENTERYLQVMNIEKKTISIYMEEGDESDEDSFCQYVELTIKDAERLMDEIHNAIIKAEGGKNGIY
jgi:hypothetical protein